MLPINGAGRAKSGKKLPRANGDALAAGEYAKAIAKALQRGVGLRGGAAKQLERWTGASNRTVRGWLSGARGPSGEHLLRIARHSDTVLEAILVLALRRDTAGDGRDLMIRRLLTLSMSFLDVEGEE
ncbi:XRE family transcriptional regulator [Roseomonas eburnea]|uniref:XRE family transcriptional regulator n=1 Tax=Neoroseomonas eburnea TaxID=1346889 RepID=A0A9X9XH69_9PROT|nr:hypothetical protein [Neoroseomonas eburnea]MBR0683055.1 XRE family transcriptional regulator [Neoroseomonas eburnea]